MLFHRFVSYENVEKFDVDLIGRMHTHKTIERHFVRFVIYTSFIDGL